jgi:hypothetical protein
MPDLYDVRGVNDDIRVNIGRVHPLACTEYETLRGIRERMCKSFIYFYETTVACKEKKNLSYWG